VVGVADMKAIAEGQQTVEENIDCTFCVTAWAAYEILGKSYHQLMFSYVLQRTAIGPRGEHGDHVHLTVTAGRRKGSGIAPIRPQRMAGSIATAMTRRSPSVVRNHVKVCYD
jgi:hypothetical protein